MIGQAQNLPDMGSPRISNKVVVITGGAKGLGRAMASGFVKKGARVVIFDRDKEALQLAVDGLDITGFVVDVTSEVEVMTFANKVASAFGRIDIWINNAGIWMPQDILEDVNLEKAQELFQINVFGTIHGTRAAVRQMKLQRGEGTIVNIVSTTAFDGMNGSSGSMYVASKYALRGLTNVLRDELKDTHIQVIGVYPGGIKTDIFEDNKPEQVDQFMSPEDVAKKIIGNLEQAEPETELVLKRPGQTSHTLPNN